MRFVCVRIEASPLHDPASKPKTKWRSCALVCVGVCRLVHSRDLNLYTHPHTHALTLYVVARVYSASQWRSIPEFIEYVMVFGCVCVCVGGCRRCRGCDDAVRQNGSTLPLYGYAKYARQDVVVACARSCGPESRI